MSFQNVFKTVVQLGIYSDKENANQLEHAMYSLKESMRWDEDTFGLECDLDVYNVVATNDFNMGAMYSSSSFLHILFNILKFTVAKCIYYMHKHFERA